MKPKNLLIIGIIAISAYLLYRSYKKKEDVTDDTIPTGKTEEEIAMEEGSFGGGFGGGGGGAFGNTETDYTDIQPEATNKLTGQPSTANGGFGSNLQDGFPTVTASGLTLNIPSITGGSVTNLFNPPVSGDTTPLPRTTETSGETSGSTPRATVTTAPMFAMPKPATGITPMGTSMLYPKTKPKTKPTVSTTFAETNVMPQTVLVPKTKIHGTRPKKRKMGFIDQ